MKTLKLLNKNFFTLIILSLISLASYAEEQPVDIWNLEKKEIENKIDQKDINTQNESMINQNSSKDIFSIQSNQKKNSIKLDEDFDSKGIKILGLYDPEDNDLDIDMWSNSNGDQLRVLFSKLNKMNLSDDASEIMKVLLLTNAYPPKRNISEEEFLKFKSNWLIKNSDLDLIEEYIVKNQILNKHPNLTRFLVDKYLSSSDVDKACNVFSKNSKPIINEYLSKFNLYCLIKDNKIEEALLILDLKKELGFKDQYFEDKINFLIGYSSEVNDKISEKTLLSLHLAHETNSEFFFFFSYKTKNIIWKYLGSHNLLNSLKEIDISDLDKISTIEKEVHKKNYSENELFEIYKRFQFNINQLLNAEESYKTLSKIESRALIYQKILLESDNIEKLKLLKLLKKLFKDANLDNAFNINLKKYLKEMNPEIIPPNLTSFYYTNLKINENNNIDKKIKFNNDILHQSKLLNYFNGDYSKSKIEKDIDNYLKKIKKNKKYFFSKRDQIFLESLKSDGVKIAKKYDDLYKVNQSEIPSDMQVMINNNEKAAAILRIVEVLGQDKLEVIDEDTIYFIISTLNQLDIDLLRNKILLKVLPLKV